MGHCPFCKGVVDRATLVGGGTCSHCLIEIPGEEAPTNPGEQALARQHAEEAAAGGGRKPIVMIGAAVLVGLVGLGIWWSTDRAPMRVELDEETFTPIPLAAHQNIYQESAADAGPSNGGAAGSSRSAAGHDRRRTVIGGQVARGSSSSSSAGRATLNPAAGSITKQVEAIDPTASTTASPGLITGPSISIGHHSVAETLSDPDAISGMIKRVVSRNSRQLQDCYNDRIKIQPELEGRWRVGFEVQKTGAVEMVEVHALTGSDPELERCMAGKLSRWHFQRIANPQGVSKNYSFTH
ncbi:MAG: AgmX/PglI C-terminal domain-containing protein [Oligoflexia bacterium]|nr:AgmX/PglI C-terminal domain-containing protein [Oligoflexia bacterium]